MGILSKLKHFLPSTSLLKLHYAFIHPHSLYGLSIWGSTQWRIQKILVGGDLKHKTSKIRMSSPKLRVIFRPKSEIQTFFSPKFRWSPKVFTRIETEFSAEIGNSNVFFAQIQLVSKKKKKKKKGLIETDFSPDWLRLGRWGGMHPEMEPNYSKQRLIFRPKLLLLGWWGGCIPPIPPPKSATGSTHKSYLSKLQTLQNKAVKIIGDGKYMDQRWSRGHKARGQGPRTQTQVFS